MIISQTPVIRLDTTQLFLFRSSVWFLSIFCLISCSLGDSELSAEHLDVEHRSGKSEPFLDRIASLFTGGAEEESEKRPVRPIGPVYRPPIRKQATAGSLQRPIAVPPPQSFNKYPPTPPRIGSSASNLSPVSQPGKIKLDFYII